MAKGKHAAALFEVIHADRRFGKKTSPADSLSTPKWWFKGRGKVRLSGTGPATNIPAPSVATAPEPLNYLPSLPGDPTARRVDVKVDPDRQEIAFKLTYTSAIVCGFALLVVLSLAYVIGRRMSQGPAGAMAATVSTNDLRKGPAQPGVMDLAKAARDGAPTSIAPDGGVDESANVIDPTPNTASPTAAPSVKPTTPVEEPFNGKRIINKNYMVMQSFPESEKALAEEAVKRLNQAGIGATLEHGLRGWPATWYNVVGTMPFERTGNNPVYEAYYKSVMNVSAKYAGQNKFKKFEPTMKKWTEN
jgi:hypothetical protein